MFKIIKQIFCVHHYHYLDFQILRDKKKNAQNKLWHRSNIFKCKKCGKIKRDFVGNYIVTG